MLLVAIIAAALIKLALFPDRPAEADPAQPTGTRDLAALGEGTEVNISRQDWASYGDDPFLVTKTVVIGIAVLVLLLGALGLVNIALVTVKQRVREIGIRRSFGATAGRVFFAVMMESVVATVVAGAVGVMASILIVQSPWLRDQIGQGMVSDFPPSPWMPRSPGSSPLPRSVRSRACCRLSSRCG